MERGIDHGYRWGAAFPLSAAQREELVVLINDVRHGRAARVAGTSVGVLGGRGAVCRGTIVGVGPVIVKGYRRGGLWGHLVSDRYLRVGKGRSLMEFELLERVRELGVRAPEPLAWVERSTLLYRAWLVTREIPEVESLVDVAVRDEARAIGFLEELSRQVSVLIEHGILHVDLHPGNAIVSCGAEVYIVDFDKAILYCGGKDALRDAYLRRWRRAVIKHSLPDILSEAFCMNLRRSYEHA